jgi:hypothetical protein
MDRRTFLKMAAAAPVASAAGGGGRAPLWGNLVHLSYSFWEDHVHPEKEERGYRPFLRFDEKLWRDITEKMAAVGMNAVVLDLGDGVRYRSHPEIAVEGAWTTDKLRAELARLRRLGLEPLPKLNFSAAHDAWLGPYGRMVSTEKYYAVCRDLIAEVIALFDRPRFFHVGMDEEDAGHQRLYHQIVVRQGDLWWHDLDFYVDRVIEGGSRPWMWSDYVWHHPELFFAHMRKQVLQSNWYYGTDFGDGNVRAKAYGDLEAHGFDQVPTGSNWTDPRNFGLTVEHARAHIATARLLGFLQTPWRPTIETHRQTHMAAIDQVGAAIAALRRAGSR